MDVELFMVLGWASPIGIGILFVCVGAGIWLLRKSRQGNE